MKDTTLIQRLVLNPYNGNPSLEDLGKKMATLKNQMGYPPDLFLRYLLEHVALTDDHVLVVIQAYCADMIEHKRASGAGDKAINRTRQHNLTITKRYLTTGEMGEY